MAHPSPRARKCRCSSHHFLSRQPAETSVSDRNLQRHLEQASQKLTTCCPRSPSQIFHPFLSPLTVKRNPSASPKLPLACACGANIKSSPALTRVLLYSNSPIPCGPATSVSSVSSVRLKRGSERVEERGCADNWEEREVSTFGGRGCR
jgi:hypothetical protein